MFTIVSIAEENSAKYRAGMGFLCSSPKTVHRAQHLPSTVGLSCYTVHVAVHIAWGHSVAYPQTFASLRPTDWLLSRC